MSKLSFIAVVIRCQQHQTLIFLLQHIQSRLGDLVAAFPPLHPGFGNDAGFLELFQQVVKGAGADGDASLCHGSHFFHNVHAVTFFLQTQKDVKHLLRQGLEFFSCHVHHLLYSIIDNS